MITFKQDTTLYIVEEYNETTEQIVRDCDETFKAGEFVDANIVSQEGNRCELQFGDGSVAQDVHRDYFDIL